MGYLEEPGSSRPTSISRTVRTRVTEPALRLIKVVSYFQIFAFAESKTTTFEKYLCFGTFTFDHSRARKEGKNKDNDIKHPDQLSFDFRFKLFD